MVKLKKAVRLIRKESQKGNLVEKESLKDVVGIGADEVGPLLARLPNFPEFTDLKSVTDGNGVESLYSVSEMTDRYMEILLGLKNKNLLEIIAETVRYESQKYPRPTRVDIFTKKPYSMDTRSLVVSFITVGLVRILCDMLWPASDVRLTWLQA
jgi:hypothetical protein